MASESNAGPNFIIAGAAKSGTTSLVSYLAQHPAIGISRHKEPNYFVFAGRNLHAMPGPAEPETLFRLLYTGSITEEFAYRDLFAPIATRHARGEGSARYLYYETAPEAIHRAIPEAKILMVLRNPVDRLWSHYTMMRSRFHLEPASLKNALRLEEERKAAGWDYDWHYSTVSRYLPQVRRYIDTFGTRQVRVIYFDDFSRDPLPTLRSICKFLDVDSGFTPDMSKRKMVGYASRIEWLDNFFFRNHRWTPALHRLLGQRRKTVERQIKSWNRLKIPQINPNTRAKLRSLFSDEYPELEKLIGKPLPESW